MYTMSVSLILRQINTHINRCSFIKKGPLKFEGEDHFVFLFSNVFILAISENNGMLWVRKYYMCIFIVDVQERDMQYRKFSQLRSVQLRQL